MPIDIRMLKRCELDKSKNDYLNSVSPIFRPIRYAIWMIRKNGTEKERAERKAVRELESAAAKVLSSYKNFFATIDTSNRDYYNNAYKEAINNFYRKFVDRIGYFEFDEFESFKDQAIIDLAAQFIVNPDNFDKNEKNIAEQANNTIKQSLNERKAKLFECSTYEFDDVLTEKLTFKKRGVKLLNIFKVIHKDKQDNELNDDNKIKTYFLEKEIRKLDIQIKYVTALDELNKAKEDKVNTELRLLTERKLEEDYRKQRDIGQHLGVQQQAYAQKVVTQATTIANLYVQIKTAEEKISRANNTLETLKNDPNQIDAINKISYNKNCSSSLRARRELLYTQYQQINPNDPKQQKANNLQEEKLEKKNLKEEELEGENLKEEEKNSKAKKSSNNEQMKQTTASNNKEDPIQTLRDELGVASAWVNKCKDEFIDGVRRQFGIEALREIEKKINWWRQKTFDLINALLFAMPYSPMGNKQLPGQQASESQDPNSMEI